MTAEKDVQVARKKTFFFSWGVPLATQKPHQKHLKKAVFEEEERDRGLTDIFLFRTKRPASTQLHMVHLSFQEPPSQKTDGFLFLLPVLLNIDTWSHSFDLCSLVRSFIGMARFQGVEGRGSADRRGERGLFSICQFNQPVLSFLTNSPASSLQ